jgi:hypothetical protein
MSTIQVVPPVITIRPISLSGDGWDSPGIWISEIVAEWLFRIVEFYLDYSHFIVHKIIKS